MEWIAQTNKNTRLIMALAIIGFAVAGLAYYDHVSADNTWCNINATFNCDLVNKSTYSEIFGVPVAALGMVGYLMMFVLLYEMRRRPRMLVYWLLWLTVVVAVLASLILAGVSAFLIGAWCLVCLSSYFVTLLILVNMIFLARHKSRHAKNLAEKKPAG